jgi:hypothetical protein
LVPGSAWLLPMRAYYLTSSENFNVAAYKAPQPHTRTCITDNKVLDHIARIFTHTVTCKPRKCLTKKSTSTAAPSPSTCLPDGATQGSHLPISRYNRIANGKQPNPRSPGSPGTVPGREWVLWRHCRDPGVCGEAHGCGSAAVPLRGPSRRDRGRDEHARAIARLFRKGTVSLTFLYTVAGGRASVGTCKSRACCIHTLAAFVR